MRSSDYEILYDLPAGEYDGRGIEGVRTVTWRAGRSLEVICHPANRLTGEARREARRRRSRPAVQRINRRNRERHMMRLLEANFTARAWVVTLTYAYPMEDYGRANLRDLAAEYERRGLPWDAGRVRKDLRNLTARIKRRMKQRGVAPEALKWCQVIEEGKEPPVYGLPPRYHVHAVIEAPGLTREEIDALWEHGAVRCERFDLRDDGAARLARYMGKQLSGGGDGRRGGRWWSHSRNLAIPQPRVSDRRISRRRMARIAADVQRDGVVILEALYPGYKVVELPDVKYSDFGPGCYIYARMRKRE